MQADFESLQNQPRTKPKPRNKTNKNLCWPKLDLKTLKPISATRQSQPETMPTQKPPPTKKPRTCPQGAVPKPACWKKYWPKLLTWKTPPLKIDLNFWANYRNETCESNMVLHLLFGTASQRIALPACGRVWTMLGNRKNSKPEKCL